MATTVNRQAFEDGYRSGRLDRLLGRRSQYSSHSENTPNTYVRDYCRGYNAAFSEGRAS